jgi:outer membrane protein assembly factor BamD
VTAARRVPFLVVALVVSAALTACGRGFEPNKIRNSVDLYRASMREFERKKWENAVAGFDLLATQLPARDTLLPRVYWYLGQAHGRRGEHLLAAQSYSRINDAFPDDSLADDALFEQGRQYERLWRKPALDPEHGRTALATFRSLLSTYPESPLIGRTESEIARLNDQLARKDLETGEHYLRRKAYDSAIIYFRDITRTYPDTPTARKAYLRLIDAYRAINYREDITEVCGEMRQSYPNDAEARRACGPTPTASAPTTTPPATTSTPTTAPIPPPAPPASPPASPRR